MPRVISFIVLLGILVLVGAVFFQVMAQFLVPLFLAAVLLVVFEPLHAWALWRLPGHPRLAAMLTTVLILLVVLLPLTWLGWKAYVDCYALINAPKPAAAANGAVAPPTHNAIGDQAKPEAEAKPATTANDVAVPPAVDLPTDPASPEAEKSRLAKKLQDLVTDMRTAFTRITGITVTNEHVGKLVSWATSFGSNVVLSGLQSALGIVIGLAIMVVALYYFLADGPGMVRALMQLSPLDAKYERELLERFGQVSRAVVVAVLLSALVQGSLAGIGYYFALPSWAPIFLLTALTMVAAMIPFVGATLVWLPVCIWVYLYGDKVVDGQILHEGNTLKAILLAIYSTVVVSGVDNIIKPFVLHGQSNLHPLLALLSILGGVQVLGPVGILVGPMLVSFLQALLNMLRIELDSFSEPEETGTKRKQLAKAAAEAALEAVEDVAHAAADAGTGANAVAGPANAASAPAAKSAGAKKWKKKR